MNLELRHIVARAYQLFESYKVDEQLDVCTACCMDPRDELRLRTMEVADIPLELLMSYNDNASTSQTTSNEFKHFLPRYLELISEFNSPSHSMELCFTRLEPFLEEEWSMEELNLIAEFSSQFFEYCLHTYPLQEHEELLSVLIMLDQKVFRIESFLAVWEESGTLEGLMHFRDLIYCGFKTKRSHKLRNGFASDKLALQLHTWMNSERVKERIKSRIEEYVLAGKKEHKQELAELSQLYELL